MAQVRVCSALLNWSRDCSRNLSTIASPSPKPYSAVPKKSGVKKYLDYFSPKSHEVFSSRIHELGPIFRERMPSIDMPEMLVVCDPDDVETVFRADGIWPIREGFAFWDQMRDKENIPKGVFFSKEYEEWHRQRKPMSRFMMMPRKIGEYYPGFNEITDDLLQAIVQLRNPNSNIVQDVPELLFKWSFESVSYFVLGKRLGALDINNVPEDCQAFINGLQDFFTATQDLLFGLPLHKIYSTKAWKTLERTQMEIYKIAVNFVEEKLKEIREADEDLLLNEDDIPQQVDFLTYMIHSNQMSLQEISINATDLMGAGVDTTSYTLAWCLYTLAINPEVQSKLQKEIINVVGENEVITPEHIHRVPYLRHCIRESQRLFPIAPNNSRILNKDIVLSGYHIPQGTFVLMPTYTMGRLPHLFPEPDQFKPERWERGAAVTHQFSSLPFGFGPRMCVGRRVAELELHIALAHIVKRFTIGYSDKEPIEPKIKIFLVPNKDMNLTFLDN